jgi:MoaA/NifB/PqqE/SkfB family radical SAM enzyme
MTMASAATGLNRIWAEITGNCQLECMHCYADSGPGGSHGKMTAQDWMTVIDDARDIGAGMVQFIGGSRPCTRSSPTSCATLSASAW